MLLYTIVNSLSSIVNNIFLPAAKKKPGTKPGLFVNKWVSEILVSRNHGRSK